MIVANGVSKRFGRVRAVDGVSFSLGPGEAMALWGSNGAGKTTLIRCVLGVIGFRGAVSVDGHDVRRRGKHARSRVGYVPQELAFHDDMRLGIAMSFFGGLRGVDGRRAAALLERVGLSGHERKRLRDLSGGMKQRLALAIAMLSDPPLIVLDEPTSNLDASGRNEVVAMLRDLRQAGKALLFASHRADEVVGLADRVLVMERGRVVRDTTPAALWPSETGLRTVRLHVAAGQEAGAAALLREAGLPVNLNGHGLCVTVASDGKAHPIGVLTRASVEVRDFEVLDGVMSREDS